MYKSQALRELPFEQLIEIKAKFDEVFTEAKIASGLENLPKPKEKSKGTEIVRPEQ